jgi:hypothetical protein
VAYIEQRGLKGWRDMVWVLMTAAGMLLLAFVALSM